jgi:chromosome partitioning protein
MIRAGAANQKGGVGKTTNILNIARAAHLRGLQVLVMDLDSQANTTTVLLGTEPDKAGEETIADVLSARTATTLTDVVRSTGWANVQVVPSGGDVLAEVENELVMMPTGREYRLREAFEAYLATPGVQAPDVVLVDLPPSLGQLVINGLTFLDVVIIVTEASLFSANGIARLLRTIEGVRKYNNPSLQIAGTIINAFEARTRRAKHWRQELETAGLAATAAAAEAAEAARRGQPAPDPTGLPAGPAEIWQPVVPKATVIADAQEAGVGLDEWGTTPARLLQEDVFDVYLDRLLAFDTAAVKR